MMWKMTNSVAVTVALVAVFAVPVLCVGGILTHSCDCGAPAGCNHEDRCSADPCSKAAIGREDSRTLSLDLAPAIPHLGRPVARCLPDLAVAAEPHVSDGTRLPTRTNMPFAASDLPLLV